MALVLEASNVSFAFGHTPVLRDVSLTLSAGEMVILIGPNGSGKSTLIRTLQGQHSASGSINWDGRPLSQWSRRALAQQVGYLPQSPTHDMDQRVVDVLRLGRAPYWASFGLESQRDVDVVRAVAERLALTDLLDRSMDELSGGQRQRVFVGRALVQEPKALLLDEPNTFLDLKHQVELSTLLKSLARESGVAVLMASHDLNLAGLFADRLILLDTGAIAAKGSSVDVLQPEILTRVYGVTIDNVVATRGPAAPVVMPRL